MPKVTSQRTFSACWTCRRRNVRCDIARPRCSQCERSSLVCEGYGMRLVWVDQETGAYTPLQRRTYACNTTWSGYPRWTSKQVDHLIEECERQKQQQCRCGLHQVACPFTTFSQYGDDGSADDNQCEEDGANPTGDIDDQCGDSVLLPETDLELDPSLSDEIFQSNWAVTRIYEPSQLLGKNEDENRIFHHYISYLSTQMVPIDFENNPWKSTYPSLAAQEFMAGSRSLYYALIAFSGLHLAKLQGLDGENSEVVIATRYYGLALREIRESISQNQQSSEKSYEIILASMIVMTLAENGFEGMCRGWRVHLAGALQFVMHHVTRKSWTKSRDAWDLTQTLAMFAIIAETTSDNSRMSSVLLDEFLPILHIVMAHRRFGYLVGGNARLLNAIYQVQHLEEQVRNAKGTVGISSLMRKQAEKLIQELHVSTCDDDDIDTYLSGSRSVSSRSDTYASFPKRGQVKMHLELFAASALIYCQRNVLGAHPFAVVGYVYQVLSYANTLMDSDCGAVFIWSVFIAAVEAYTPEAKALATLFFSRAEQRGGPNRKAMHRVIRQVWADREWLASKRCCDPSEVAVDWRQVMEDLGLGVDILLL